MEEDIINEIKVNDLDEINIVNSDIIPVNLLDEFKKSICQIIIGGGLGTGFLIKLLIKKKFHYYCITCAHVIEQKSIKSNKKIKINYNYNKKGHKKLEINLNEKERFIREYLYLGVDATVVEILEKEIDKDCFFFVDKDNFDILKDFKNNIEKYKNKSIFIFQIPKDLSYSCGKIISNKNLTKFYHSSSTISGSSGSPILLYAKDKIYIIGIHQGGNNVINKNIGNYIDSVLESLKEKRDFLRIEEFIGEIIENGGKKGKAFISENEYYIGDIMNSRPHGKGTLFRNNKIVYFGDFINGKFEGKGTLYYENGEHYIGEFKNNFIEGKGKLYYGNNEIKYDGYFKEGKYDGEGIYLL